MARSGAQAPGHHPQDRRPGRHARDCLPDGYDHPRRCREIHRRAMAAVRPQHDRGSPVSLYDSPALADDFMAPPLRCEDGAQASLAAIDWSFEKRERAPAIEAIHPYPAKFIGDIPRALLGALPLPPRTLVFDPFCGCGTTLLEAQRRGIPSVGVDLNPIACLIARVKTSPAPDGLLVTARELSRTARANKALPRWDTGRVRCSTRPSCITPSASSAIRARSTATCRTRSSAPSLRSRSGRNSRRIEGMTGSPIWICSWPGGPIC